MAYSSSSSSNLSCFSDIWGWISNLPPLTQWKANTISICISTSQSTHNPTLVLSITKSRHNPYVTFSLEAAFCTQTISLWTSTPIYLNSKTQQMDEKASFHLFQNIINGVLSYGPKNKKKKKNASLISSPSLLKIIDESEFKEVFHLSFFTLAMMVCIYEALGDFRSEWLEMMKDRITSARAREASKALMRLLGSNLEEQWMRSINLAITNRIVELKTGNDYFRAPCSLFSYSLSTIGFWKVQLYCPTIAMTNMDGSGSLTTQDERLLFSLNYQQLEGVMQFAYRVTARDNWIDVVVSVDNIRCDVISLVPESLMSERGLGSEEKHFPSRISLQLTPTHQHHVISVSVGKSSDNPAREVGIERGIEGGFDPPNPYLAIKITASESVTTTMKPWKFEQSVHGDTASLNWYLHDGVDGREVISTKPSKLQLLQPRAWFRDRYSSAYRVFTKQGGVVFAGDEYGESVCWRVGRGAAGRTMEWELRGWIWVTYWPNKHRVFHSETRRLEFREVVQVQLPLLKH